MWDTWQILFFYLILVFSIFLILLYLQTIKQKRQTFLWFFYFISLFISFFLLVVIFLNFRYGKFLLYFLFKNYNIQTVLRDPQEILDILFSFGFWVSLFVILTCLWFYLNLYVLNLLRKDEYRMYNFVQKIVLYFLCLSFLLLVWDLLFFHTDVFSQQNHFKFEPDILKWYRYYESEYKDLLIFLFFFLLFYICILNNSYTRSISKLPALRFIPFILLSTFSFYFFGGESLYRDLGVFLVSFLISEIVNYTASLFSFIKRYK
jgi:hypothetical protein